MKGARNEENPNNIREKQQDWRLQRLITCSWMTGAYRWYCIDLVRRFTGGAPDFFVSGLGLLAFSIPFVQRQIRPTHDWLTVVDNDFLPGSTHTKPAQLRCSNPYCVLPERNF